MAGDACPQLSCAPALPSGGVPRGIPLFQPVQLPLPGLPLPLDGALDPLPVLPPQLGQPLVPLLAHLLHPAAPPGPLRVQPGRRTVREGPAGLGQVEEPLQNLVGGVGHRFAQIGGEGVALRHLVNAVQHLRDVYQLVRRVALPGLVEELGPQLGELLIDLVNVGGALPQMDSAEVPAAEVAIIRDVAAVLLADRQRGGAQVLAQAAVIVVCLGVLHHGVLHQLPGQLVRPAAGLRVEQGVALLLRHGGQAGEVIRVVSEQDRVVEHGGGHEDAGLPAGLLVAVRVSDFDLLPDGLHGLPGGDEPLLDPAVAHAAGVCLGPHVAAGPRSVGAVSGKHVAVFLPQELGQLVEVDEVVPLALVVGAVLGVLHGAEEDFRPAGEGPHVLAVVEPGPLVCPLVDLGGAVHELGELREGLAENQPPVVGDFHLPQGLGQGAVRLASTGGPAVQGLVLKPGHKRGLPGLGPPRHVSHGARLPPPAGRGCP